MWDQGPVLWSFLFLRRCFSNHSSTLSSWTTCWLLRSCKFYFFLRALKIFCGFLWRLQALSRFSFWHFLRLPDVFLSLFINVSISFFKPHLVSRLSRIWIFKILEIFICGNFFYFFFEWFWNRSFCSVFHILH